MKKTIAIITNSVYYDEHSLEKGCGGSETWALQLSRQFTKIGYNVILFIPGMQYHIARDFYNIEFANYQEIILMLEKRQIDFIILSRVIDEILYEYISKKNIPFYYMIHDVLPTIVENENVVNMSEEHERFLQNVEKIVLLSTFHYKNFRMMFPDNKYIPKLEIIPNGIDFKLFDGIDRNSLDRDNSILVSSTFERGLPQIVRDIAPLVRKKIPDFEVYVAGYNDYPEYRELEDKYEYVHFLGKLSKVDLYKEMVKHKVWFYPGCFPETFCITAIENMFNNVEIVSSMHYGLENTVYPAFYNRVDVSLDDFGTYDYNDNQTETIKKKFPAKTNKKFANAIINAINNYNDPYRVNVRKGYSDWVYNTYDWKRIANIWDLIFLRYTYKREQK